MKKAMFWLGVGACAWAVFATGVMVYVRLFWNGQPPYNLEQFWGWHIMLFCGGIILAGPVSLSMQE